MKARSVRVPVSIVLSTLLAMLIVLPVLAYAADGDDQCSDSDCVNITVCVPCFLMIMLANEQGEGPLTEMDPLEIDPTVEDLERGYTDVVKIGYLHCWGNTQYCTDIWRTDNAFSAVGIELWEKCDGLPWYELTSTPIQCWSDGVGQHAWTDMKWQIRGLSPTTPAGCYLETVTVDIYEGED